MVTEKRMKPTKLTTQILCRIINEKANAYALITGENDIHGTVALYDFDDKTLLLYQIENLPVSENCEGGIFGFHIHSGESCNDPQGHLNPNNCEHPYHLGDLPPLFAFHGVAWGLIMIDKFRVEDVLNRTFIVHRNPDDFHTQPSGNSGMIIACGEIKSLT